MDTIKDQLAPVAGGVEVGQLVLADIEERIAIGLERYGTKLKTLNGRDALVDAYQEAIDLVMYLRQEIEERNPTPKKPGVVTGLANDNGYAAIRGFRYRLEPGDGTRYEFSLLGAPPKVCSGVGQEGRYVNLAIHSPGYGSYEVSIDMLRHPASHFAHYLGSHFTSVWYTLMAVTLACSVLVDRPYDLEGAGKEMLRVPEFR